MPLRNRNWASATRRSAGQAHLPSERHQALRGIGRCACGATNSALCSEGAK